VLLLAIHFLDYASFRLKPLSFLLWAAVLHSKNKIPTIKIALIFKICLLLQLFPKWLTTTIWGLYIIINLINHRINSAQNLYYTSRANRRVGENIRRGVLAGLSEEDVQVEISYERGVDGEMHEVVTIIFSAQAPPNVTANIILGLAVPNRMPEITVDATELDSETSEQRVASLQEQELENENSWILPSPEYCQRIDTGAYIEQGKHYTQAAISQLMQYISNHKDHRDKLRIETQQKLQNENFIKY